MKILLFGKSGLLGGALFKALNEKHGVVTPSHNECDVCNVGAVRAAVTDIKPEIVINATGYTQVDKAEEERERAYELNEKAVKNLVEVLSLTEIPLVHFSTDYVFDGKAANGYRESDPFSPLSVYGSSKAAGDKAIIKGLKNYFLIRTAWLFGPGGKNFVDTMLKLREKDNKELKVVSDQIGNPTYTVDLAQAVLRLLESKNYGIYHIVNEGDTSWYGVAVEIFRQLGIPQKVTPITTKEFGRPAARPAKSVLRNTKLPALRSWKEALEEYLTDKQVIL